MSSGLAASTVTPGSTAPDASVTTPEMEACVTPCAAAEPAANRTQSTRLLTWAIVRLSALLDIGPPPIVWLSGLHAASTGSRQTVTVATPTAPANRQAPVFLERQGK